jgi:hypothetical protein
MKERLVFIGDFSGLSLFLSRGVTACGAETVLYSNGDGWKGIPRSRQLFEAASNPVWRAWSQFKGARSILASVRSSDTLVLSTEFLFNRWIDAFLLSQMLNKVGRTVLLHAGCSDGFHRLNRSELLCQNCKKYDLSSENCVFDNSFWPGLSTVLTRVDKIVPFTDIFRASAKLLGVPESRITAPLHFPIDFNYVQSTVCDPIQRESVIHGQNRIGFKGTAYLREMMKVNPSLQQHIKLLPRLSFIDFINRLGDADVILDQLFANGYGMTGALALAKGTSVVYGHTAPQPASGFGGPGCLPVPIIGDALEDARALEQALRDHLLDLPDRNEVIDLARRRHDHIQIGATFLDLLA